MIADPSPIRKRLAYAGPGGAGKIVALRAGGLGDLIVTIPALRALRRQFPADEIILACPRRYEALMLLSGAVDRVVDVDGLALVPEELYYPDIAVNLHGRGPQSHRLMLSLGPDLLLAFANSDVEDSWDGPPWHGTENERARWCHMLEHHGIPADPKDLFIDLSTALRERADAAMAGGDEDGLLPIEGHPGEAGDLLPLMSLAELELNRLDGRPFVPVWCPGATIIHPGASPSRRWPLERWAAIAAHEDTQGRNILITGSADEMPEALEIARLANLPARSVLAGRTDVLQLAILLSIARRVVCGDSGIGQLAMALATPSVQLFGPRSPEVWGPPDHLRNVNRVIWGGETGDAPGSAVHPGLLHISAAEVVNKMEALPPPRGITRKTAITN